MGVWPGIGWSAVSAKASAMAVAASGMVGFGVVSGVFWEVLDAAEEGADSEIVADLGAVADSEVAVGATDGADI